MQKWDAFIEHLRGVLGALSVDKWLKGVRVTKFDVHNIHLDVCDDFQIHWFREQIEPLAKVHFTRDDRPIRIHFCAKWTQAKKPLASPTVARSQVARSSPNLAEYSLKDLQPTSGQRLAHRLLDTICSLSQKDDIQLGTYNPIFLYGSCGSGKSHLMKIAAAALTQANLNVIYLDGDAFTEDVVGAIRRGEMDAFRKRYRRADVLIIDGVEKLGKKSATQEEFFHTFNTLHTSRKQIILSAPQHPQSLASIEERLTSRFEWGIAVELDSATAEELVSIASKQAEQLGLHLEPCDLSMLIANLDGNLKNLTKALEMLAYKRDLLDVDTVQLGTNPSKLRLAQHLQEVTRHFRAGRATPQVIIDQVAAHFGILSADIIGKSQSREFTRPRRLAMYLCRSELQLPFVKIGEIFQRDHSTVMSNCRNIEQSLSLQKHLPDLKEVSLKLRDLRI